MQRPMSTRWPVRSPGEGQLAVAALQVLEVLADDSNFRRMAMRAVAASAAIMLTTPPADFESAWCAGVLPAPSPPGISFRARLSVLSMRHVLCPFSHCRMSHFTSGTSGVVPKFNFGTLGKHY